MPNKDWHKNAIVAFNIFVKEIAGALPTLISILLRVALLYLFFWYLFDFIIELFGQYFRFALVVTIAAIFMLGLIGWKMINAWPNFDLDKDKEVPAASLFPFVLLDLIPIIAVGVATWYAHYFSWGLLQFTQYALQRIASVL